jgi:hypothetical protein
VDVGVDLATTRFVYLRAFFVFFAVDVHGFMLDLLFYLHVVDVFSLEQKLE